MIRFEVYIFPVTVLVALVMVASFMLTLGGSTEGLPLVQSSEQSGVFFGDNSSLSAGVLNAVMTDGLVAYWSFDEGGGVVVPDRSFNKNDGVLKGSPTWADSSLFFDGVDDYVLVTDHEALRKQSVFTIATRVKSESMATGVILSEVGDGYALSLQGNHLVWGIQGHTNVSVEAFPEGFRGWVSVAVIFGESLSPNTQLYVEGVRVLSSTFPSPTNQGLDLLIGRDSEGNYFNGYLDEIRIYSRALSEQEIKELVRD